MTQPAIQGHLPTLVDSKGGPGQVHVAPRLWLAAAALTVVIAALLVWRSLPGRPAVEGALQLTDDGNPKLLTSALLSDGYGSTSTR